MPSEYWNYSEGLCCCVREWHSFSSSPFTGFRILQEGKEHFISVIRGQGFKHVWFLFMLWKEMPVLVKALCTQHVLKCSYWNLMHSKMGSLFFLMQKIFQWAWSSFILVALSAKQACCRKLTLSEGVSPSFAATSKKVSVRQGVFHLFVILWDILSVWEPNTLIWFQCGFLMLTGSFPCFQPFYHQTMLDLCGMLEGLRASAWMRCRTIDS